MDLASLFGQQGPQAPPSAEYLLAAAQYHDAVNEMVRRERAALVKFAGVFCTCTRFARGWLDGTADAGTGRCPVHGQLLMGPDGETLP